MRRARSDAEIPARHPPASMADGSAGRGQATGHPRYSRYPPGRALPDRDPSRRSARPAPAGAAVKPAARVGDMHTCPMVSGTVPHVGGPILPPCATTVTAGGIPAARVGDRAVCVGPPDSIVMGSLGVFVEGKPFARLGDPTAHGGVIVAGCPTVLVGDIGGGGAMSVQGLTMSAAKKAGAAFTKTKCDGAAVGKASKKASSPAYFVQQKSNSCVVASSRNLIKMLGGKDVEESKLRDEMAKIMGDPKHDFNTTPINPAHATTLLKNHGIETTTQTNVDSKDLGALTKDKPVMVGFKNPGHRVLLKSVEVDKSGARTYLVVDPAPTYGGTPRKMNQAEFDKKYNPKAIVIIPKK